MNKFILNTKQFFNKKPVRIMLALLIIAVIMTGVAFGIMTLNGALNPPNPPQRCPKGQTIDKTYNTCLKDACANKEDDYCNTESGGNIKGGVLDSRNFPSCGTCICTDDKILNSKKTECIDKCGNTGTGCENGNVCAFLNNTSTDVSNDNLQCFNPSSYSKCKTQINNNNDVYCNSAVFTCVETSDGAYCKQNTPSSPPSPPSPSGKQCDTQSGYACISNSDCNSGDSINYKCNNIFNSDDDWRKNIKLGICDNKSTVDMYSLGCISNETAKKSLSLNNDNAPILCNKTNSCKYETYGITPGNTCNDGCCNSNVCIKTGYCPIKGYECLTNGDLCKSENIYDNNSSCCSNKVVNGKCLNICDYSPFNGTKDQECNSQKDCDDIYNNKKSKHYLGNIYTDYDKSPTEISALCIKKTPTAEKGLCKLACGNEDIKKKSTKIYSCGAANGFSFCNPKQGLCHFSAAKDFTPPNSIYNYDGNSHEKIICNDNSGNKHWKAEDSTTPYSRNFIQILEPSSYVNQKYICNNVDIFNEKMKTESKFNYAGVTDIQYCSPGDTSGKCSGLKSKYDYLYITQSCNNSQDIGPIYSDTNIESFNNKFENFENVETTTQPTIPYRWDKGTVLQKKNISPIWNEFGYYNYDDGSMPCVNGQNVTSNCKYLQNSLFCDNGSLDGTNCLNFDPTKYSLNNLCTINQKPSTPSSQYGNNFICTMPYSSNQNKQYKCSMSGTTTNGFGINSCCGIGYIIENDSNNPVCSCGNNMNKINNSSPCNIFDATNFLQANNFKSSQNSSTYDWYFWPNNEGNQIKIIGNSINYLPKNPERMIKQPSRNYLIILQYKNNPKLYLNVDNDDIKDGTKLALKTDDSKLGVFWRQSPDDEWGKYSTAGNIYTCLTYYDYSSQHYGKFLNGVQVLGDKYAVVSKPNQTNLGNNIKPIIIIDIGNNEYALGAIYIEINKGILGMNPSVYINSDGNAGKLYIASIDEKNDVVFTESIISGTNDPNLNNNIRGIKNVAIFKCKLILDSGSKDDKFLKEVTNPITTINDLINQQFNIGNYKRTKTINELLNMFSKVY